MKPSKPRLNIKTVLLPIVGLVAFFLYVLIFNVDLREIVATAQRADPLIYFVATAVSLAEVFFFAISWRSLLAHLRVKISVIKSYLFVWYGIFMDIVIPAESISGELVRIYLVNREQEGTGGKVVASVVTQRILGMGMNIAFLAVGIYFLFSQTNINPLVFNLILFIAGAIAALIAALLVISSKPNWSMKAINALIRFGEFLTRGRWKQLLKIKENAIRDAKVFHDSMREFAHKPTRLIVPTLLLGLNWICSFVIPYLVFLSLGLQVPLSTILITSAIVVAVKSIPIGVPFEVGLPEVTMTTFYIWMGVPAGISATATILSRIITLWLRFGLGFAAQQLVELRSALIPKPEILAEKA